MERSLVSAAEIGERLEAVGRRVAAAADRAGRDPKSIRIVAVSKSQPAEVVRVGFQQGLHLIGENRVEETEAKRAQLADLGEIEWHMVGHIQSRKAERAAAAFDLVHSIDRLKIARRLDAACAELGKRLPVLMECNVSGEASKYGWPLSAPAAWPAIVDDFSAVRLLPNLRVVGLMTVAPMEDDPERVRPVFRKLRQLRDFLDQQVPGDWSELSMGMTDDFEVAIEEGATLLRIGRAIFGPRRET